jgi:hypothetical protein
VEEEIQDSTSVLQAWCWTSKPSSFIFCFLHQLKTLHLLSEFTYFWLSISFLIWQFDKLGKSRLDLLPVSLYSSLQMTGKGMNFSCTLWYILFYLECADLPTKKVFRSCQITNNLFILVMYYFVSF